MNSEIKNFFDEKGYYLAKSVFSTLEINELESEFDRIVHQLVLSKDQINATWTGKEISKIVKSDDEIIHTHNVHRYSARWLDALKQERFLNIVKAILGEDVILHHNKLFKKPAEKGSPFPMHQDWSYFPTINDTMIAGIVHVSDATDEMGCLRVYEGSHKLGRQQNTSGQYDEVNELLNDYPIEKAKIIEAKAGDVLFFHYFTLHGSMPNRSHKTRKTVLVQMHSGQDRVEDGNKHPNEAIVLSGWNTFATRSNAGHK